MQALHQVTVVPGRLISSSTLAGHTCAPAVVRKGWFTHVKFHKGTRVVWVGTTVLLRAVGSSTFMCSAASALGQAWKWIRWLQGDKFWHPGVLQSSLDISTLSCILLCGALTEMCVSARAASVWSHGDVDEQLAVTYPMSLLLSVCEFQLD